MDIAYDHITEETLSSGRAPSPTPPPTSQKADTSSSNRPNLNTEFQDTFRAFSNSPWGAKLGGLWGNVRKQGEQYYEGARREVEEASEEALRGISDLKETIVKQTRNISLEEEEEEEDELPDAEADDITPPDTEREGRQSRKERTQSEVIRENDSLISRFRSEATKRLKDIEEAEDAADKALLRFGTNIRNFLRDAVAIAPPADGSAASNKNGSVLFESKDSTGKRVIHTTRFDAQLHVIHSTSSSLTKDPVSDEWPKFKDEFKTDQKTEDISKDLERYPDLRRAMEQLVPEEVDYKDFWCRYYFLRLVIETEEQKRKELLKGASAQQEDDEEIAWDADSDEEGEKTPSHPSASHEITLTSNADTASTTTISADPPSTSTAATTTIPATPVQGRRSHDQQSQPDSDASYDLVSGATSKTPGSPKVEKERERGNVGKKGEESDEEDWE